MKKFEEFENDLDKIIEDINLSNYPLQSILILFHMSIGACCLDEKLDASKSSCNCDSIPSIFSYLLSFLNNCDVDTIGSATDMLSRIPEELKNDFIYIVNYGAFCEIAPYVWRGVYNQKVDKNLLELQYNQKYYESEKKDIILSSLATTLSIGNDRKDKELYSIQVTEYLLKGKFNSDLMKYEIETSKQWYKKHWYDNSLVPDEIYPQLGFTKKEYFEFQTFWLAFSDYYIKSSNAIVKYMRESGDDSTLIGNEYLEHISPHLKKEVFFNFLNEEIIGVNEEVFFKIMDIFAVNVKDDFSNQEGYFPTFFEFKNSYIFSPFNIRTRLSPRNLLYILLKTNQKLFDDSLSHFLEPNLIKHAVSLLQNITSLKIEVNKNWGKGEFDIVIYEPETNIIIHVQAKGTIPAEGARMTKRLESRMSEGIKQLNTFKKSSDKNQILSEIFNTKITDPIIIDVLLGSAGFGTEDIWDKINNQKIVTLNLSLLHIYIQRYNQGSIDLKNFFDDINQITNEIVEASNPLLEDITYQIGDKTIVYSGLKYESSKLIKYKYI